MAWTAPTTRTTGTLITASIWNTDIVDNLDALKDPPTDLYNFDEASDYTTSSTSFADVDSTNLAMSITTTGGDILVTATLSAAHSDGAGFIYFDIDLDGTRQGLDDGIVFFELSAASGIAGATIPVTISYWIQSVSAGAHTVKLQWKTSGATASLWAGAATASKDVHPQFAAREAS